MNEDILGLLFYIYDKTRRLSLSLYMYRFIMQKCKNKHDDGEVYIFVITLMMKTLLLKCVDQDRGEKRILTKLLYIYILDIIYNDKLFF